MATPTPSLATVLSRWMHREKLRPAQVARAAGLTRHHVSVILQGKIARPHPETLRQLAVGVATHPFDGVLDEVKRDLCLRELSLAAGYVDLTGDPVHGDLVRSIRAAVGNEQVTMFYHDLIRQYPAISPTVQQLILALIQSVGRPGSESLMSMLILLNAGDTPSISELVRRLNQQAAPPPGA